MNNLEAAPPLNTEAVLVTGGEVAFIPTEYLVIPATDATPSWSSTLTAVNVYSRLLHAVRMQYQSSAEKKTLNRIFGNDFYQYIININKLSESLSSFPSDDLVSQGVYTNCLGSPPLINLTAALM